VRLVMEYLRNYSERRGRDSARPVLPDARRPDAICAEFLLGGNVSEESFQNLCLSLIQSVLEYIILYENNLLSVDCGKGLRVEMGTHA
jgi:hypothetical protein